MLFFSKTNIPESFNVEINGFTTRMQPLPVGSLCTHINVLGAEFGSYANVFAAMDYRDKGAKLFFRTYREKD